MTAFVLLTILVLVGIGASFRRKLFSQDWYNYSEHKAFLQKHRQWTSNVQQKPRANL